MTRYSKLAILSLWGVLRFGECAEAVQPPWVQPAVATASGAQSVLTDVTRAGDRLVAVGEHGIVILSDDQGRSWRQAKVPVSVTLCAVRFVDAQRGWAVGHGGVILATQDGGANWRKQLDGRQVAALIRAEATATGQAAVIKSADQFEQDGPDKPFLDVLFVDARRGWAVGAYGLFLQTEDGGATWTSHMAAVENPKGSSIYAIATDGKAMYLAGEQGWFARGDLSGAGFRRLHMPVESSWFTLSALPGRLVVGGLGGVLLDSEDAGSSWQRIETGTSASIVSLLSMADGQLLVGSQGGEVMTTDFGHGARLGAVGISPAGTLQALVPSAPGQLVTVGFRGVAPVALPEAQQRNVVKNK